MTIESMHSKTALLAESFEKLKRAARSTADIQDWLKRNQDVFSSSTLGTIKNFHVVLHDRMDSNYVILGYDRNRLNEIFNATEPDASLSMGITAFVDQPPRERHPFLDVLSATNPNDNSRNLMETWSMPIIVSEWSFMVGLAASHYVQCRIWDHLGDTAPYQNDILAAYLDEHLSNHFPGITPSKLEMLQTSGLLDQIDDQSILNFLFNTRNAAKVNMDSVIDCAPDFDSFSR